jgi:hypothetical protein
LKELGIKSWNLNGIISTSLDLSLFFKFNNILFNF